jgi:dihydroorotate dehydrogenase (NAD+) catalytic subunit
MKNRPDLRVKIGGLTIKNPVMMASGTGGYGEEYSKFFDLSRLGAFITKGLSLLPRDGNPPPRLAETSCGLLNSIGLENIGIDAFIEEKLPFLREKNVETVVNFFGETEEDYKEMASRLSDTNGISAIEMNVSCPNVKRGGMAFGADPITLFHLVEGVKKRCTLPLIVKLSPNVTDISLLARASEEGGADALTVANTYKGMAVDLKTRRPLLSTVTGGLSGPAIKPITMRLVWETVRSVKIPVIATGGIMTPGDAIEYMIVGARAVQIGTANFINPIITMEVIKGIEEFLENNNISSVEDIIGTLKTENEG